MYKLLSKFLIIIFFIPNLAYSAGSLSESEKKEAGLKKFTPYKSALARIKKAKKYESKGKIEKANKNYEEALKYLYKANKEKSFEPDILNFLFFGTKFAAIKPMILALSAARIMSMKII